MDRRRVFEDISLLFVPVKEAVTWRCKACVIRSFSLTSCYCGDRIKEDEVGETCSTLGR
jgi:hypothetical protein